MTFNQRELAAFLAIARAGGVGAAAKTLSLTQPAITRSLKRLEQRLGVALFVRHATGMEMTPFGRALTPYAEMLESETRRVVEEIRVLNGAAAGLARIGIVPSVAANLLPLAIERLLAASPDVQVNVVEGTGDQMAASLARGEIDFAIVGLPRDPIDEHVIATPLLEDEICVVGRAAHPLMKQSDAPLAALTRCAWTMPEKGNVIRAGFHALFRRAEIEPPRVAVTANSVHTLKSIVAETDLLTMLARVSIQMEERAGILAPLPLAESRWRRRLGLLRRATGQMLPASRMLLAEIQKLAARDQPAPHAARIETAA